MFEER